MESQRWKEYNNGNSDQVFSDYDRGLDFSPPRSSSASIFSNASPSRLGYIEHPISKLDTLAGIAIKYGVEVSDIKKLNGLVTDLQMFGLKTIHIPLPGRHPPSDHGSPVTVHSNSDFGTQEQAYNELFDSFYSGMKSPQLKVSPNMSPVQGFYRLKPTEKKTISEGCEMALYRKGASNSPEDPRNSASSHRPGHRKSRSLVDVILSKIEEGSDTKPANGAMEGDSDKRSDKLVRRRQKSEVDFAAPELLMKEDNSSSTGFSPRTGKGLALRQKSLSRNSLTTDPEASGLNPNPVLIGFEDIFLSDTSFGVKKSSSTSCLQDEGNSSFMWPTSRRNSKADLQAYIAGKSMFDGLPKPITTRRNKAALD